LNYTSTYIYNCLACSDPNCDLCYPYWYGTYSGLCYTCKKGYAIDVTTNSKNTCDVISIQNCAEYYIGSSSGTTYCYTCDPGYIKDSTSKVCLKCNIIHCTTCVVNNPNSCSTCESGYNGANCAMNCITNCKTCSAPGVCGEC
jgi:proprotein convertase subtilisin/kexin type 5